MLSLFRRNAAPEPTALTVEHGGRRFEVAVARRPGARRITLRVSGATGRIVLTLPPKARFDAARRFADQHGGWIAERVARIPQRISFALGSEIPLRGVPHRVEQPSTGRIATRAQVDEDGQALILVGGDPEGVPGRVRRFLQAEAGRDLRAAVEAYTAAIGIPARRISLRDTRSRWGSCSAAGGLSFSWRLILAPPFVLDYLAAHEVGHLKEMNHSARYWRLVRGLCPRTDEAERWLKANGAGLHRFG